MKNDKTKKPLNIEQAGNFIRESEKTAPADIRERARQAPITVTPEKDRKKYLLYATSLLTTVNLEVETAFLRITGNISSSISRKDIAATLKRILLLRIYGCSCQRIAWNLKEREETIEALEKLGTIAVADTITKLRLTGIPILGGNAGG